MKEITLVSIISDSIDTASKSLRTVRLVYSIDELNLTIMRPVELIDSIIAERVPNDLLRPSDVLVVF